MRIPTCCALLALTLVHNAAAETTNWPQFRGPQGDGLAEGATLPETWSAAENVVWKAEIPGWGWSSPVVWGERIFLTSAVSEHDREKLVIGGYPGGRTKPTDVHRWVTYCLDLDTGEVVWKREAHRGVPAQERHSKNSYANATPITDGERVYAYIGNIGLFCYDMDGNKQWERRWGSFPMRGGWGPGASPVLHGDRIYLVNDNEQQSFMVALDKLTGQDIWKADRQERSNWSTPYVWQNKLRTEIVTIGKGKVRSYDTAGQLLWELAGTLGLVSQTPLAKHGLLYVGAGYHYGPLYAVRPGAAGDISLRSGETTDAQLVGRLNYDGETSVVAAGDIEFGTWNRETEEFTPTDASEANAVRVKARLSEETGNPLQLFLGHMLGRSWANVAGEAVATKQVFAGDTPTTPGAPSVHVTSTKDLSNVVLEFADGSHQKFEGLSGHSGTFAGTGEHEGKDLLGVWIKSGQNSSGDGPGYGERVDNPMNGETTYGLNEAQGPIAQVSATFEGGQTTIRVAY